MNCESTKKMLMAYREGSLDTEADDLVAAHLRTCAACRQEEAELGALLGMIRQAPPMLPDDSIKESFLAVLAQEEAVLAPPKNVYALFQRPSHWSPWLQVAATIALVLTGFGFGLLWQQQTVAGELTSLRLEYNQLNKLVALSLMEDQSASKRLQAIAYARVVSDQDGEILEALTGLMKNDRRVNVRLAAVNALAEFADNETVVTALISTLKKERNANIQLDIIQILIGTQAKLAIPTLRELLEKQEVPPYVKEQIQDGLAQMS